MLVAVGFALTFFGTKERLQESGHMIMGMGLIFFGMEVMGDATRPLRAYGPFITMMQHMNTPFKAILFSAAFTGIIQSSAATIGVVIVLASQGFIQLETGIALVFGANIGTCATALLAAIGKPREAVQTAMVHILFNTLGVVLWYAFIEDLAHFATWLSPSAPLLSASERLAVETPRQIANAHTVFNVGNTLVFIWFTRPLAWLVQRLVPTREPKEPDLQRPRYLDEILLCTPALALDTVRMELGRLGSSALRMVRSAMTRTIEGDAQDLEKLEAMDKEVDALHAAIITHLGRLSQEHLNEAQGAQLQRYIAAANYLESIGDIIETNLVAVGNVRLQRKLTISEPTREVLGALHEKIVWSVEEALHALVENEPGKAHAVLAAKNEINDLVAAAEAHLSGRLAASEPDRLALFRVESELIEYLRRIYYFAKRVAKLAENGDAQRG